MLRSSSLAVGQRQIFAIGHFRAQPLAFLRRTRKMGVGWVWQIWKTEAFVDWSLKRHLKTFYHILLSESSKPGPVQEERITQEHLEVAYNTNLELIVWCLWVGIIYFTFRPSPEDKKNCHMFCFSFLAKLDSIWIQSKLRMLKTAKQAEKEPRVWQMRAGVFGASF